MRRRSSLSCSPSASVLPRKHVCPYCKFAFTYWRSLTIHIAIHYDIVNPGSLSPLGLDEQVEDFEDSEIDQLLSSSYPLVIGPMWCDPWLTDYSETVERLEYKFVDAHYLTRESGFTYPSVLRYLAKELGLSSVYAIRVQHSYPTYAGISSHPTALHQAFSLTNGMTINFIFVCFHKSCIGASGWMEGGLFSGHKALQSAC